MCSAVTQPLHTSRVARRSQKHVAAETHVAACSQQLHALWPHVPVNRCLRVAHPSSGTALSCRDGEALDPTRAQTSLQNLALSETGRTQERT